MTDYQQYDYPPPAYPQQPPPQPPKKRHPLRALIRIIAFAAAVLFTVGVAVAIVAAVVDSGGKAPTHATSSAPTTSAAPVVQPPVVEEPSPIYITPTTADFAIKLKILTKECFDSAGCVITYRPQLVENFDAGSTDPSVTYDVSYTVSGGQDGPIDDTLYATGDQYTEPMDGTAQTANSGVKLTARVTAVEAE